MLFITPVLRRAFDAVVNWFDDRFQDPIMRRHINDGSRKYFHEELEYRDENIPGDFLGRPRIEDDDEVFSELAQSNTPLSEIQNKYKKLIVRFATLCVPMLTGVTVFFGASGRGPAAHFMGNFAGDRISFLIFNAIIVAGSTTAMLRSVARARELRQIIAQRRLSPSTTHDARIEPPAHKSLPPEH